VNVSLTYLNNNNMHDELGKRMKENYEMRTRMFLPRRTYTMIRLDGKAFHTFTKEFNRPYDEHFSACMDYTALKLCENIQGAKFAYVQSDEISILLTDFNKIGTDAWFDGNVQKITSVSASIATAHFNHCTEVDNLAYFDSRVWTVPDPIEVENTFIWRQQDAVRNSIQMTGQSLYSQNELHGKGVNQIQDMCFEKGTNWNDQPTRFKRGGFISKVEGENGRTYWQIKPAFDFLKDREMLTNLIPTYNG